MNEQVIEIEADSLEEARERLRKDDLIVLEESILRHMRVETIEGIADSANEAVLSLQSRIPPEAVIETNEIITAPEQVTFHVQGADEESAGKALRTKKAQIIESISLHKKGRKGFLGFFKTPNLYEVVSFQQAIVEVTFRVKARLQVRVKSFLARDLLQVVQEIRTRDTKWVEALQLLNPKTVPQIKELLDGIKDNVLIDRHTALNIIEGVCHRNENANWHDAITDAHKEARRARIQTWIELRGLDADLADVFMFYSSVDWYPKYQREPTGIPMHTRGTPGYGRHPPDQRHRQTIPRYSTDKEAFSVLERRARAFGTYDLCKQFLDEKGQDERTATSRQKCDAILKARKLQLSGFK